MRAKLGQTPRKVKPKGVGSREEPAAPDQVQALAELLIATSVEALPQQAAEILSVAPVSAHVPALARLAEHLGEGGLAVIAQLAQSENQTVALAAIKALGRSATQDAARPLVHLVNASPSHSIRDGARQALFQLRQAGIDTRELEREEAARGEERPEPRLFSALASYIDGHGHQALLLGVEQPLGGISALSILVSDREGIVAIESHDTSRRKFNGLVDERLHPKDRSDGAWADLPPAYGQYLVQEAYERSRAQNEANLPSGFAAWRELLTEPKQEFSQPLVYSELSSSEALFDPTLLETSPELLKLPEFSSWLLLDDEETRAALRSIKEEKSSPLALPSHVEQEQQSKAIEEALQKVFGPEFRALLKRRLEEMALILLRTDQRVQARRSLAAAQALDPGANMPLAKHPWVKALIDESFAQLEEAEKGTAPSRLWLPHQEGLK